jgi:hypothetical protein
MSPAFQRWAATVDWDHPPWPFNVLIEMPPEQVVPDPGIGLSEMLDRVVDRMSRGLLAAVPCQGNADVVVLVAPINQECAELSIYSIGGSFSTFRESQRILSWLFHNLPYKQYAAANNIPKFRKFLNRLGFVGPIEIPHYHPLGGSWLYYYITDETRNKGQA